MEQEIGATAEVEVHYEFNQELTIVFRYDDTGLTLSEELALSILHFDDSGQWVELGGVIDPDANTLTMLTDNFSPFLLGTSSSTQNVREPATLALISLGLIGVGYARRRRRATR